MGEWGKTPFLIHRRDGEPFGMAGLWEAWHDQEGEPLESCTVIVTDANTLIRSLHDRMPVILSAKDYDAWLDPGTKDTNRLRAMLRPADSEGWVLQEVSRKVNSPRNDGPDLLDPIAAE